MAPGANKGTQSYGASLMAPGAITEPLGGTAIFQCFGLPRNRAGHLHVVHMHQEQLPEESYRK